MANPQHLAILRKWAEDRDGWLDNSFIADSRFDLVEANLNGINLSETKLNEGVRSGAKLNGAKLSGAKLSGAKLNGIVLSDAELDRVDLSQSDLSGADLSGVDLCQANLSGANFSRADLSFARLYGADLSFANLSGAKLHRTFFPDARLLHTIFADTDLSRVYGLDSVVHSGPSSIGIDTYFKSGGEISKVFLRGCGVPDIFIDNALSLARKTLRSDSCSISCFIFYVYPDKEFAERLRDDFQEKGIRCWLAGENAWFNKNYRVPIPGDIPPNDKLVLVYSESSFPNSFLPKGAQITFARRLEEKRLKPFLICLDESVKDIQTKMAADLGHARRISDFTNWKDPNAYQSAFERLLVELKAKDIPTT